MKKDIRIVQLIDSLDAGGAERMAVNYANTLADVIPFSGLVTTRKEGALKGQLSEKVTYMFLNKQGKLGWKAVLQFRDFIKKNKIDVIHAHSSSFFTAVLVKISYPKVKIVWHDHFGNRMNDTGSINSVLKLVSFLFYGVLTVNKELEEWAKQNLAVKKTHYFPNFITTAANQLEAVTILNGTAAKRIVFLANLKNPKNHLQVVKAFAHSTSPAMGWTLHLIGKDFLDSYSKKLKVFVAEMAVQDCVFIYDSCIDVESILEQSDIGILGSTYEGFPVTLLEYGKAKLAVLSTNVGYCSTVIRDGVNGLLFDPCDGAEITVQLNRLTSDVVIRKGFAALLHKEVMECYSDQAVISEYLDWLDN